VTFGSSLKGPQMAEFGPLKAVWPADRWPRTGL
jgi:hypothetical protein